MIKRSKARERLLAFLPKQSVGAEIGVFAGAFSERILYVIQPSHLYLVDLWQHTEILEQGYGASICGSQSMMDTMYKKLELKFHKNPSVTLYRMSSIAAADKIPNSSLHWVYIDADHEYPSVSLDLKVWTNKVKSGGYVCGDDYGSYPGVTQAVDEWLVNNKNIELIYKNVGYQFLVKKLVND